MARKSQGSIMHLFSFGVLLLLHQSTVGMVGTVGK